MFRLDTISDLVWRLCDLVISSLLVVVAVTTAALRSAAEEFLSTIPAALMGSRDP
jgi:hypothetical protein